MDLNKPLAANSVLVSGAAFIIIVAGMKASTQLLMPFLLAIFIAVLCAPLMIWLRAKKVPSTLAVLLVVTMLSLLVVTFSTVIGSSLSSFYQDLPSYEQKFQQQEQAAGSCGRSR